MSEEDSDQITERDDSDIERLLEWAPKTKDQQIIEEKWPNIPSWIWDVYTPRQWLWVPAEQKKQILQCGLPQREREWTYTEE